jgi:hypothetical protein
MAIGRGNKLGTPIVFASLVTLTTFATLPASADPRSATAATYVARRVAAPPSLAAGAAAAGSVEFEVTGNGSFPARALDPVLHIGSVDVRQYRYQGDTGSTLVFTVSDASRLVNGAPVALSYEPGNRNRIDLAPLALDAIAP